MKKKKKENYDDEPNVPCVFKIIHSFRIRYCDCIGGLKWKRNGMRGLKTITSGIHR